MDRTGLVSVNFRANTPEEIVAAAKTAGLSCIEWGSDVHAPPDRPERLREIAALCRSKGIGVCSYGTYIRIGQHKPEELSVYIRAAELLGTRVLRLWCGDRSAERYGKAEWDALLRDCRCLADMAERHGVTLCMECHNDTVTETEAGALRLMESVASPAFRMYWQPNQFRTVRENLSYAAAIAPYTERIHVFEWKGHRKFPLEDGRAHWKKYLSLFPGEITALLEFMPDGRIETLPREAASLRRLLEGRK